MISGVSSNSMSTSMMSMRGAPPPPPDPEEKFAELDTDGNGSISDSELETMASEISEMTGQNVTVEDLLEKMDSDGNGSLEVGEMQPPEEAPMGPPPMDGEGPRSFTDTQSALSQYAAYGEEEEESSILSLDMSA